MVLQLSRVKDKEPKDECMQMAADLAAFYSDLRDENKALVTFTNPRHISKPNGAPLGAVRLREEDGTIVGRPTSSALLPTVIVEYREKERALGLSNKR